MSVLINERKRTIKKKTGATIRHKSMAGIKEEKIKNSDTTEPGFTDKGSDTDVPLRPLGVMVSGGENLCILY
jgi:hypothetical protein